MTLDRYEVTDYTSVYFGDLPQTLDQYPQFFDFIDITTDEKIENVAYQLYGSENYADLILACNEENFLWSSPYNQDIILDQSQAYYESIRYELNLDENDTLPMLAELKAAFTEKLDNINSTKKRFRVPKPESLTEVITIINDYKSKNNDTQWRTDIYD
jgi:hypothetical protein